VERRRVAYLPAAVLGNGSLLATLSARGELERLFWPHVDFGQHLGELRLGLAFDGRTRWLDEEPFAHEQAYVEDASVLVTTARDGELAVEITDVVAREEPVLARRVRAAEAGVRLVAYCRPELDGAPHFTACYVDPPSGALVFYRRDRALAVALVPRGDATCGRTYHGEAYSVLEDAEDGRFDARTVAHRSTEGALAVDLPEDGQALLAAAFGASPAEALRRLGRAAESGFERLLDERVRHDADRLAGAEGPGDEAPGVAALYRRSLLALDLMADRTTGAVIAAPELDPAFEHCGGYGFVWARDLAFVGLSFLTAGRDDLATGALRWLRRAQSPEGLWLHRHWSEGFLAPSWGLHQVDETGAVLFLYEAAWRELRDEALDRELWPSARAGADFLRGFLDPETGLTMPSVDLWEERVGEHAYSAAAVTGGLAAAAAMAERHEPARAAVYAAAAAGVRAAIESRLWSDEHGRYLRSRLVGRVSPDGDPLPDSFRNGQLPYPIRGAASVASLDATVDVSLLGLAWPFAVVDPESPRMRATVAAVARELELGDGGVLRYAGDRYAGGNPWLLATLWLGLCRRQAGDVPGHRRALEYAVARQTSLGLLPEQATREGRPAWVVPLAWSHAMLVLAARPELPAVARAGSSALEEPGRSSP
jgi:oligosaccharide amylase